MVGMKQLNKWLAAPLVVALVMASTIPSVLASHPDSVAVNEPCETKHGRPADKPIPPGQLTRRGVIGNFVGISEAGNILVETKFGVVEVVAPEGFDPEAVAYGSRIAAHLEKPASTDGDGTTTPDGTGDGDNGSTTTTPDGTGDGGNGNTTTTPEGTGGGDNGSTTTTPDGTGDGDNTGETDGGDTAVDSPIRVATALRIVVVPTKTTLSHERGIVVDGDGDGVLEEGEDAVFLTRCAGNGAKPQVVNIQKADKVAERLLRLQAKNEDDPEKAAKFAELLQKHEERVEARLLKTSGKGHPKANGTAKPAKPAGADGDGDDASDEDPPESEAGSKGKGEGQSKGQSDSPPKPKDRGKGPSNAKPDGKGKK